MTDSKVKDEIVDKYFHDTFKMRLMPLVDDTIKGSVFSEPHTIESAKKEIESYREMLAHQQAAPKPVSKIKSAFGTLVSNIEAKLLVSSKHTTFPQAASRDNKVVKDEQNKNKIKPK